MKYTAQDARKEMTESRHFRQRILNEIIEGIQIRAKEGYDNSHHSHNYLTKEVMEYVSSDLVINGFKVKRDEQRFEISW